MSEISEDDPFAMANLPLHLTGLPMVVWASQRMGLLPHDIRVKVMQTHDPRMNPGDLAVVCRAPGAPADRRAVVTGRSAGRQRLEPAKRSGADRLLGRADLHRRTATAPAAAAVTLDLTEEEERALIALLRGTIDFARFPYAARYGPLQIDPGEARPVGPAAQALAAAAAGFGPDARSGTAAPVKLPSALRRPRAFWISVCNIAGLLFSLVGVVLLFFFALPNEAPGGPGALWRTAIGTDAAHWEAVERRYNEYSRIGLVLVVAGTLMEAVPPFCTAVGSWRRRSGCR